MVNLPAREEKYLVQCSWRATFQKEGLNKLLESYSNVAKRFLPVV